MKYLVLLFLIACSNQDRVIDTEFDKHCIEKYNKSSEDTRVQVYIDCVDELLKK